MRNLLLTALLLSPLFAEACSFAPGYEQFKPSIATFTPKLDGNYDALLPPPAVSRIQVTRGKASPGSSCADAGTLTLDLTWPKTSVYRLGEVGFYFRVLNGKEPDRIFPLQPVSGKIVGQRAQFFFVWLDGHPSDQSPLSLDVEVFAVNKGLEIGASRRFRITDEMR